MRKNKLMSIVWILGAFVAMISLHSCEKVDNSATGDSGSSSELSSKFKTYELIKVDNFDELYAKAKSEPSTPVTVDLNIKSHPDWKFEFTMDKFNKDIFDNTEFYNLDGNDKKTVVQLDRVYGLSGKLNNSEHNTLFLFNKEYFEGEIVDGDKVYFIEQANKYDASLDANTYIVYDEAGVIESSSDHCDELKDPLNKDVIQEQNSKAPQLARWTKKADVAYIGDYQLYRKYWSWSRAHNYMYYRMVYASKRYYDYNHVNFELRKRYGGLYTGTGGSQPRSYWNAGTFLDEWQRYYNRTWFRNQNADLHYLFTGYNIQGNIVGMAWVGTVCRSRAYAFGYGQHLWSTTKAQDLMAHEIGHNLGCNHTSGYNFMAPSLSRSNWTMAQQTRNEVNWMLAYNSSCLSY